MKQRLWRKTSLGVALPLKYGKARSQGQGHPVAEAPVYGSSGVIGTFDRALTTGPSLIVGRKGSVGSVHYSPVECWPIDTVFYVEKREDRSLPFFRYLLEHLQLGTMDRSTAVPGLSRDDYNSIEVYLPLLNEQQRIVAEIEKQFTRLDAGVGLLKQVRAALKMYRASILKAACEGRLVATEAELARKEGRSYETGEQLLARILIERRKTWNGRGKYKAPDAPNNANLPHLPEGWVWLTVETIAFVTKLAGFEYTKFVEYSPDGDLAVIKAENAGRGGFKRTEFSCVKSSKVAQLTRSQLRAGDLLMVFVGAGTGNVARVPDDRPYFLGPNIGMIRIESREVSAAYVELFLRSPAGNKLALGFAKAVAQPSLSMGAIRMIPLGLPPLAEQGRIVAEVERRFSVIEELETVVTANLKRAKRLRQSILHQAFCGELLRK
jgi:type I restriction enzyme, S subunit